MSHLTRSCLWSPAGTKITPVLRQARYSMTRTSNSDETWSGTHATQAAFSPVSSNIGTHFILTQCRSFWINEENIQQTSITMQQSTMYQSTGNPTVMHVSFLVLLVIVPTFLVLVIQSAPGVRKRRFYSASASTCSNSVREFVRWKKNENSDNGHVMICCIKLQISENAANFW